MVVINSSTQLHTGCLLSLYNVHSFMNCHLSNRWACVCLLLRMERILFRWKRNQGVVGAAFTVLRQLLLPTVCTPRRRSQSLVRGSFSFTSHHQRAPAPPCAGFHLAPLIHFFYTGLSLITTWAALQPLNDEVPKHQGQPHAFPQSSGCPGYIYI